MIDSGIGNDDGEKDEQLNTHKKYICKRTALENRILRRRTEKPISNCNTTVQEQYTFFQFRIRSSQVQLKKTRFSAMGIFCRTYQFVNKYLQNTTK